MKNKIFILLLIMNSNLLSEYCQKHGMCPLHCESTKTLHTKDFDTFILCSFFSGIALTVGAIVFYKGGKYCYNKLTAKPEENINEKKEKLLKNNI